MTVRRIVAIMGTDGSGKTTLSMALVGALRKDGIDAAREWLGAESIIMAPVRSVLRLRWRRAQPLGHSRPGTEYSRQIAQKHATAAKYKWAQRVYVAAVLLDYRVQLAFKLFRNRRREVVVADRYLFDVIVTLSLTLGLSTQDAVELAQRQFARIPLPQVRIFLRVDPEVSMQRKSDIPDIDYVRLRFQYYEAIASAFGFMEFDGMVPVAKNAELLRDHVVKSYGEPHVHYVHANNLDIGGADLVLVSMAHQMRSRGQYRTSVSLRLCTAAARAHADLGTPVLLAPFVRPQLSGGTRSLWRLFLSGPSAALHFWRLFGRERPDIVHVNDLYDFIPAIVASVRRIPVVYHVRMIKEGKIGRAFQHLLPRISGSIISVSEAVRRAYELERPPREGRNFVIHDFGNPALVGFSGEVTANQPRPADLIPGERLVVMVGRIQGWKGQHIFLEAVSLLPPEVRERNVFVLVGGEVDGHGDWGSAGYFQEVTREADRLGVQFLGERNDVPALLLAADVSVHCSIKPDPLPGVVIESLLAGAATVASAVGGVPEIVPDSTIGLLYCPGDAQALASHLLQLLTQETSPRATYAETARRWALQFVAPDAVAEKIDSVYKSLLSDRSRWSDARLNLDDSRADSK